MILTKFNDIIILLPFYLQSLQLISTSNHKKMNFHRKLRPYTTCDIKCLFHSFRLNSHKKFEMTTQNPGQNKPEDKGVKLLKLEIGEQDPITNSLVSLEMQDTHRTGFRKSKGRKKSCDKIFSKIRSSYIDEVDKSKLRGLPRRSLANDLDLAAFCRNQESDDDEIESNSSKRDENVVKMLDLKIGEQDPTTNSLVALEMQDTKKIGFRRKCGRKKSIDRIFGNMKQVHIVHEFDKSPLKGMPRRSLASNLDPSILKCDFLESDDEDLENGQENKDDNVVKLLSLDIGEKNPATNSLVALEMQDTKRTGFKKAAQRKKSIDRIFGKIESVSVLRGVDPEKMASVPRRSLAADFDISKMMLSESDDYDEEQE
ncbi:hypothetical protein TRFO_26545 [Tritrichomonas foetus]|uniref:Uncharacterized protein n=1 Tax=Tritrichomonas foetus TaxID=1144522 RepID=A0A1J4K7C8_9EUKA|nr:hypothetical protein TRFO_26545 [Tritrichomonas foetus]|eukprot:OHT05606.1 hypothetical protein TRFO_26545 [Tritrichomonas foetus]